VRLESLQTVSVTRDVLGKMRPLDLPTATTLTTGLKPPEQVVTAIPEKLQSAVDQRQGALALATAVEVARNGLSRGAGKEGGKIETMAGAKVTDDASGKDAIVPVSEVSDGAATLVGGVMGSLDAAVVSLSGAAISGTGTVSGSGSSSGSSLSSGSGGSLGNVVGTVLGGGGGSSSGSSGSGGGNLLGNSGPGSIGSGGGGKGPSPALNLPLSKKK